MYTVSVRDHMMIAHSLKGAAFGPAQQLHGATYVVDVEFHRPELNEDSIVVDIGRAGEVLRHVLAQFNYTNLDEHPDLHGRNTTTEFLARLVFNRIADALKKGELGAGADGIAKIRVTLHESHVAAAGFEGPVAP